MALLTDRKFIHFNRKSDFEALLNANAISDKQIVFLKDAQEIWTHGTYYGSVEQFLDETNKDSTNAISAAAVYKALTDDEKVIAAALNDLNDKYTNLDSSKQDVISDLDTIRENAQSGASKVSNVQADWNANSGDAAILNKPLIFLNDNKWYYSNVYTIRFGPETDIHLGSYDNLILNAQDEGNIYLNAAEKAYYNNKEIATVDQIVTPPVTSVNGQTGAVTITETQLSKGAATGTGNAVTDINVSNHQITLVKGATYATQSDIDTSIANLVDSAPETLDTLNELAAALGDDPNFATTVANQIGQKYTKPSTGIPASDLAAGVIPAAPGTLNTNNTTAQTVNSSEALSGTIKLHKISKTGSYSDLIKPSGGIPKTDLASAVQTSLGKADTSVQNKGSESNIVVGVGNNSNISITSSTIGMETENGAISIGNDITLNTSGVVNYNGSRVATVTDLQGKQDVIRDLQTIRDGAADGATAIQGVKVNGTALTPDANKAVDITVPTESTVTGWGFTKLFVVHTDSEFPTTDGTYNITVDYTGNEITAAYNRGEYPILEFQDKAATLPIIGLNGIVNFGTTVNKISLLVGIPSDSTNANLIVAHCIGPEEISHQSIKFLNTTNTSAQHVNESETIAGSGTINLHKVSKTGAYSDLIKPSTGIPKTDLASAVQTSLGKADTAIQGVKVNGTSVTPDSNKIVDITIPEGELSNNYEPSSLDNEDLELAAGDTYEEAFGKLEKSINDNEQITAAALTDLDSRINTLHLPQSLDDIPDGSIRKLATKQDTLVSGTNIKTINNESILGSGNITIQGGSGGDTNVIETVKVNGTALTPDANKAVDVTVPTNVSDLTNDLNFVRRYHLLGLSVLLLGDDNQWIENSELNTPTVVFKFNQTEDNILLGEFYPTFMYCKLPKAANSEFYPNTTLGLTSYITINLGEPLGYYNGSNAKPYWRTGWDVVPTVSLAFDNGSGSINTVPGINMTFVGVLDRGAIGQGTHYIAICYNSIYRNYNFELLIFYDLELQRLRSTNPFVLTISDLGEVNTIETIKVNNTALTPDANKAVNITSIPASIVTQDATHRFVSDTEKTTWNGKQNALQNYTENNGHINISTYVSEGDINIVNYDDNGGWPVAEAIFGSNGIELNAKQTFTGNNDEIEHTVTLNHEGFKFDNKQIATVDQIPSAVTESTVSGWGFTKNAGTITGITMNGSSKGTSGVINLGTVLTEHQTLKTINNESIVGTGNLTVSGLPTVTASDNGKILQVVNGAWTLVTPTAIYSGASAPDNTLGNNGDLYLQTS